MDPSSPSMQSPTSTGAPRRRVRRKTAVAVSPTAATVTSVPVTSEGRGASPGGAAVGQGRHEEGERAAARERGLWELFQWPHRMIRKYIQYVKDCRQAGDDCRLTRQVAERIRSQQSDDVAESTGAAGAGNQVPDKSPQMRSVEDDVLLGLHNRLNATTMSTAFSGIDTPGTAFLMLQHAVGSELGISPDDIESPRNFFAIEWLGNSQQELLVHPHAAEHVFTDISSFWNPAVADKLEGILAENLVDKVLLPLIQKGKATGNTAYCLKHGLLQQVLGDMYFVQECILNPAHFGFPVVRERKWVLLRHKYKTGAFSSPMNLFTYMFTQDRCPKHDYTRTGMPAWDVYFAGRPEDMYQELLWACSRPESKAKTTDGCSKFQSLAEFVQAYHTDFESVKDEFFRSLTETETRFLVEYRSLAPGMAYSLNQNPDSFANKSTPEHLQTLIRNGGILWSDFHGRFLLAKEALMAQGMPVYADVLTQGVSMCSFSQPENIREHIPFARSSHVGQAGNGMHSMTAGLCLLYAVTQVTQRGPDGMSPVMADLAHSLMSEFL
eukprot:s1554_g2.t1